MMIKRWPPHIPHLPHRKITIYGWSTKPPKPDRVRQTGRPGWVKAVLACTRTKHFHPKRLPCRSASNVVTLL